MRIEPWAVGFTLLLAASPALAGDSTGVPVRRYQHLTLEELMKVEVTSPTKVDQPLREAPALCIVITRDQIERYGWLTLGDVLLRQAGFAPSQDFERITVSARGQFESWNNNHLRLLIDGLPANNVTNGIAHTWEMLPLSMVESIEITRGPGSALYGSNATNGVVAIKTRKAAQMGPAEVQSRFGSADFQIHDLATGHAAPWLALVAGYRRHGSRGNIYPSYDASGRVGPDGSLRKFEVNDRRSTHAAFLVAEGRGPLEGVSLHGHYAWWRFETGHGWIFHVPDEGERAVTSRTLAGLTYRPPALVRERLNLEFAAQWQRHEDDFRIKNLPDSSRFADTVFPGGIVEVTRIAPHDLFFRAQADCRLAGDMRLLMGVENTTLVPGQDKAHASNADLDRGGTLRPFPDGRLQALRPLFEPVLDKPINQVGMFLQYVSGRILRRSVSATAGVRYDRQFFDYVDLDKPDHPVRRRALDQVSPRAGLVFFPHPDLALKALAERAFRAPAPTELFLTNSLLGNSMTDQLLPEELTAYTLAADLALHRRLNLRADWFHQRFDNQIAYSGTKNYSDNLYSRAITGIEAELLFEVSLGKARTLHGFLNHAWVHMLDEEVQEPSIAASGRLTWGPGQISNVGLAFSSPRWEASLQGHYQGRVFRRRSDRFDSTGAPTFFSAYRPATVAPWFTVDALVGFRAADRLRIRLEGRNLLNRRGYLVKPGDFPFDYRIEGVRLNAAVEVEL